MAEIEQKLQEIEQERQRLNAAKQNLKTAITGKGVTVPDSAKLDEYSSFVDEIQQGGVSGTDNVAGVLVDDGNGGLMVQKLSFDGTVASDDGEPLTADNFYIFNTGKIEPDYGIAMEIYKCAYVDSLNKTWSGFLYNTETKNFSATITEGLEYKMAAPIVGKVYTEDGMIECNITAGTGLLLYAPLQTRCESAETGQTLSHTMNYSNEFYGEYTTYKGVKCLHLDDGMSHIKVMPFSIDDNSDWTLSVMLNVKKDNLSGSTNYCAISSGANSDSSGVRVHTYKATHFGVKMYADNLNNPEIGVYADYDSDIWTHYTITSKNGRVEMYKNGVKESVTTDLVFKFYNGLYIGTRYGETDYFHGYITELKIYRIAISDAEIKAEAERCLAMVTE